VILLDGRSWIDGHSPPCVYNKKRHTVASAAIRSYKLDIHLQIV
jgi:hypothetical protein